MGLGSSDMAGSALGIFLSLLLLASTIQGLKDVQVFHNAKMEAVVGQDVVLPCTLQNSTNLKLVSIEWSKNRNGNTKLALYSSKFGHHSFWPNITIQPETKSMGIYLSLSAVTIWDSGIYICDVTTFPLGTIRRETELNIKDFDLKSMCDVKSTVEVHVGENVTIRCVALPNAQYRWTKNKKLVSENESLGLLWVTDAHTGVYTLNVTTRNKSLHREFIITVLTATTSFKTDPVSVSPQSNVTEESLIKSADSGLTTSLTTGLSTTEIIMRTDVTDDNPNPSNVTITAGEHTNYTHISVTSSPATHTDPYRFNDSNDQEINPTRTLNTTTFPDKSVMSNLSTTLSYGGAVFRSTQETMNESMLHTVPPEVISSTSPEDASTLGSITENIPGATPILSISHPIVIEDEDTDGGRSHLLLVLIIVPVLVLIVVAGFLYKKQITKQRMDLPPPFKPPPPPIKYTAARHCEIATWSFPTSRCNSVIELKETKI